MTSTTLAKQLFSKYEQYKIDHLSPGNCKHETVFAELFSLIVRSNRVLAMEEIGSSLEGRSINMVTIGGGPKKVLLWSQMHGDESTATLALMDIFNLFVHSSDESWVQRMLADVTLYFIPMLNPDGAERTQRRTAVGIDMNRDALELATPEAQVLRNMHRKLKPAFGFNLHDQELSSVGNTQNVAAIALLAPALDEKKTRPSSRVRAMRVAALISRVLDQFIHGHLSIYDDTFEPRAFGDNLQRWGTSTVLIESGHWPDDRNKTFIRKINYVGILAALHGIASGSYQDTDLDYYTHLQPNTQRVYDIIIRNVTLHHRGGWRKVVDIGVLIDPKLNRDHVTLTATIKDLGDLSTFVALTSSDGSMRVARTDEIQIDQSLPLSKLFDILQLPCPQFAK